MPKVKTNVERKIHHKARFRSSIRLKLIVSFVLPVILIITLGVTAVQKSTGTISANYKNSSSETLKAISDYIELGLEGVKAKAKQTMMEDSVNKYHSGEYKEDLVKESNLIEEIQTEYNNIVLMEAMTYAIYSMSDYGKLISSKGIELTNSYTQMDELWNGTSSNSKWISNHSFMDEIMNVNQEGYLLSYVTKLPHANGYLVFDIKAEYIQKYLEQINLGDGAVIACVTAEGNEVYGVTEGTAFDELLNEKKISELDGVKEIRQLNKNSGSEFVTIGEKEYLFLYDSVGDTGMQVCGFVPKDTIVGQAKDIQNTTYIILVIGCILLAITGIYVAHLINSTIKKIVTKLNQVGTGDLTVTFESKHRDEFMELSNAINHMLSNMRSLIGEMQQSNGQVLNTAADVSRVSDAFYTSTKEISTALSEVEKDVVRQAVDAENCLSEMNRLSEQVKEVFESSERIESISKETSEFVSSGLQVVEELSDKITDTTRMTGVVITDIEELKEQSDNIGKIIDVINQIAEETNLLSLNASIEAARAGDAGRGFAIVADQIRKLADESKDAVAEIAKIVQQIQEQTAGTVEAAKKTEVTVLSQEESLQSTVEVFNNIKKRFDILSEQLAKITDKVTEMEQVKETTLMSIESISSYTQETSAVTEEVSATAINQIDSVNNLREEAKLLEGEAIALNRSMEKFRV